MQILLVLIWYWNYTLYIHSALPNLNSLVELFFFFWVMGRVHIWVKYEHLLVQYLAQG